MLTVGIEAGGHAQLCMVCPLDRETPHATLYVVLWEHDLPFPQGVLTRTGGCLRLCWEHLDELALLIAEAL
jgi:hypothetical protein